MGKMRTSIPIKLKIYCRYNTTYHKISDQLCLVNSDWGLVIAAKALLLGSDNKTELFVRSIGQNISGRFTKFS